MEANNLGDLGMIFTELQGDDLGVYHDDNYRMVQCLGGHVVFSYSQKGKAMTAHFASDKKGLKNIKPAINSFCRWIFNTYESEMILAVIKKTEKSIMRLVKKCGFSPLAEDNKHYIYMRAR